MDSAAWKDEARKAIDNLQSVRDEIRVRLHLGRLDATDRWRTLEPRLEQTAERLAREGSEAARRALHDVVEEIKAFRSSLERH